MAKKFADIIKAGPEGAMPDMEEPPTPLEETDTEMYRDRVAAIAPDALVDLSLELMASVSPDEVDAILANYEGAEEEMELPEPPDMEEV